MKFRLGLAALVGALAFGLTTPGPALAATSHDVRASYPTFRNGTCVASSATADTSVAVNDSITWTNCDPATDHTVTATSGATFDKSLPAGGSVTITFTSPGDISYHCSIHPVMTGTIHVAAPATTTRPTTTTTRATTTTRPTTTTTKPTTTTTSSTTTTSTTQTTLDLNGIFDESSTTSSSTTTSTTAAPTTSNNTSNNAAVVALLLIAIAGVGGGAVYAFRRLQQSG